jgi:hypothetical protein
MRKRVFAACHRRAYSSWVTIGQALAQVSSSAADKKTKGAL